jgi:hypothetical protein
MKKKILIITITMLLALPFMAFTREAPTMMGSSGLIAVPTADVIENTSIIFGSWFLLQKNFGVLPRVLVSFLKNWEIGGSFDFQKPNDMSFLINSKYKFYDENNIKLAFGGNYQRNSGDGYGWDNGQLFLALTWAGWAKTTVLLGYTFGNYTNKSNIDFGIGVEKVLFSGEFGALSLLMDFANFNYRNHGGTIRGAGDIHRGIFNIGARILLFKKLLNIDFIFVDLLDDERNIAISAFFSITF